MNDEIDRRINRLEDKIDRLDDKIDQNKLEVIGDIHIIDKNISAFMQNVDDHIKEEAETIRELQNLALLVPELKNMIETNYKKSIIKDENNRKKQELFKKAKLYSAIGGAVTTILTVVYYGLRLKGLL